MTPIQVAIGGASTPLWQTLVTVLAPAVLAAAAALGGVALTNQAVAAHRREDNRQRSKDRELSSEIQDAERRRDRGLAALALAEHLENYVLYCMDVVSSFWNTDWVSPYAASPHSSPLYFKALTEWPDLVDWRQLGLRTAESASSFRRRVQLRREWLDDVSEHADPEDHHADEADYAAKLGLEAWDLAVEVRRENQLQPFEWPEGWRGKDALGEHLDKREKIKAQQAASAIEF